MSPPRLEALLCAPVLPSVVPRSRNRSHYKDDLKRGGLLFAVSPSLPCVFFFEYDKATKHERLRVIL